MTALTSTAPNPVSVGVTPPRAALYLRQSKSRDEGIESQDRRTRELAANRGWHVVDVYADPAVSSYRARGPKSQWARMIRDAQAGLFEYVVFTDMDRLLRGQRDVLALIDSGVLLTSLAGDIDLATADGEFRASIMASVARFEVMRKSERQKRANEDRAAKGKPNPGRRRYGYEVDGATPREAEADVVRWLFQETERGAPLRSLMMDLRSRGVPHGTGTGWTTRRLRDTLNSRHYEGFMLHQGAWHPSEVIVPIVSGDQAAHVREILADPLRRTTPGTTIRHQLSGVACCGVCATPLLYMRAYRCKADASHPSILKDRLEPLVRDQVLAALLLGPASILPRDESGMTINAIREALIAVQARKENTLALIREGLSDLATERSHLAVMKSEEANLMARRDVLASTSAAAQVLAGAQSDLWTGSRVSIADAARQKAALAERFDALDLHQQRDLIRMLLDIRVHPGRTADRVHITHRIVTSLNGDAE